MFNIKPAGNDPDSRVTVFTRAKEEKLIALEKFLSVFCRENVSIGAKWSKEG